MNFSNLLKLENTIFEYQEQFNRVNNMVKQLKEMTEYFERRYQLFQKLFFVSIFFFIFLLIIQYYYLEYNHRGNLLQTIEKYTDIQNRSLDAIKAFIDTLRLPPVPH
jgi:hypothetical protein